VHLVKRDREGGEGMAKDTPHRRGGWEFEEAEKGTPSAVAASACHNPSTTKEAGGGVSEKESLAKYQILDPAEKILSKSCFVRREGSIEKGEARVGYRPSRCKRGGRYEEGEP